jgi:alkylation response protein AidB-like acyl-CoA dehydrogenase
MRSAILAPTNHQLLLERARGFADLAYQAAMHADDTRQIDEEVWQAFRQSGLAMAAFGEAYGGAGLAEAEHQSQLCTLLRILGAADLSIARIFEGHVNAVSLVGRYGTKTQLEQLAADIQRGTLTGVWGADDAAGLRRQQQPNGWRLVGRKILASGSGFVGQLENCEPWPRCVAVVCDKIVVGTYH